uniref:Uncharacterized protein n=1 Tax=Globisporangium ultimum (strain ATCC 200006 / CBS 805.95 / DAOM BR144) TaxID=431595 RepID=K3X2Y9_GLOUD
MESDDDRFASVAQHDRAAAEGARNDSVFEEYADERALLDAHVIGSTASLSSSGASSFSSRSMPITEPYERYKSIELRAECYRRGTRPIRTGPKANDNKAGYLTLLRSYDVIQNGSEPSKDGLPSAQAQQQEQQEQQDSLQDFALQSAKKRK